MYILLGNFIYEIPAWLINSLLVFFLLLIIVVFIQGRREFKGCSKCGKATQLMTTENVPLCLKCIIKTREEIKIAEEEKIRRLKLRDELCMQDQ